MLIIYPGICRSRLADTASELFVGLAALGGFPAGEIGLAHLDGCSHALLRFAVVLRFHLCCHHGVLGEEKGVDLRKQLYFLRRELIGRLYGFLLALRVCRLAFQFLQFLGVFVQSLLLLLDEFKKFVGGVFLQLRADKIAGIQYNSVGLSEP